MRIPLSRQSIREQRGLLRSILIYHAIPWRHRQLTDFYRQFIQPGDLCFDIGAHVGNRVRAWRALDARVVALEPQPICMRFLQRWYGNDEEVILIDEAVGASAGTSALQISAATPTVTTLSSEWIDAVQQSESFASVTWETSHPVTVTTLDRLIEQQGLPTFCKIDIEGYELEALRGLSQPIPALSIEFIPAAIEIAIGCIQRLDTLGDYEYNWTVGERHQWCSENWITGAEISHHLMTLPNDGQSGDLYGRLRKEESGDTR